MKIGEFRKKYGVSNSWIARTFGYKNVGSYNKSAGKKRIEGLICAVVELVENKNSSE